MEPEIRERAAFTVMGIEALIDPRTADWGELWTRRYEPRQPEIEPYAVESACYGIYFDAGDPSHARFVAGRPVANVSTPPEGLVLADVPAALEAVFECPLHGIGACWQGIFAEWLPASGFEIAAGQPCYERFTEGVHAAGEPVTIHVPLRKQAA